MTKPMTELQASRCAAFANIHRVLNATKEKRIQELVDMRLAALAACVEVQVPPSMLAEMSGLSTARICQLTADLGGKPDIHPRLVPE